MVGDVVAEEDEVGTEVFDIWQYFAKYLGVIVAVMHLKGFEAVLFGDGSHDPYRPLLKFLSVDHDITALRTVGGPRLGLHGNHTLVGADHSFLLTQGYLHRGGGLPESLLLALLGPLIRLLEHSYLLLFD